VRFSWAFFAPNLDCYLHCRNLPAEKTEPFLLTQVDGTASWA